MKTQLPAPLAPLVRQEKPAITVTNPANRRPAQLYDIGTPLNASPFAKWTIPSISPLALSLMTQPAQLAQNLASLGFQNMVGHHFFTGASPVFSLDQLATPYPMTLVGKLGETDAPVSSCPGTNAEGAIKWLFLQDNKGVSKGGINTVYRLETAGGNKPATCKGLKESFEVKYAAQCMSNPLPDASVQTTDMALRLDLRTKGIVWMTGCHSFAAWILDFVCRFTC
jgi:hypothetical protein